MTLRSTTKALSILVADDVEEICQLLRQWLAEAGHEVKYALTGNAARQMLATQHFDVVVADVLMPDGDGLELIQVCKQADASARIIAISGGGKYMCGDLCLRMANGLGAHAMIAKPFKREQFLAEIGSVVGEANRAP